MKLMRPMRTFADDASDLGNPPSGGPAKMWLGGVVIALAPVIYGVFCLLREEAVLYGKHRANLTLHETDAIWLACTYICLGLFLHFHYFWGLHPRLWRFSHALKIPVVIAFIGSLGATLYRILMG